MKTPVSIGSKDEHKTMILLLFCISLSPLI